MEIKEEHNWICDTCKSIKIHSILNNGVTGTCYCGVCKKTVTVHKKIKKWVSVESLLNKTSTADITINGVILKGEKFIIIDKRDLKNS
jgi:hypothetical protein